MVLGLHGEEALFRNGWINLFAIKIGKKKVNKFRVAHLPRVQSDHSSLLWTYDSGYQASKQHRPFHFLVVWET